MLKKTFSIIIFLNFLLFIWRSILSISLSTQGDVLSAKQRHLTNLHNQIDALQDQITQNSSLEKASVYASQQGFVTIRIVRLSSDRLANSTP